MTAFTTAPAGASFGELGHFGAKGTGHGQFIEHVAETNAFGVDPTDNTVYVGDEPEAHVYRIQKLSHTGEFLASVSFKVKSAGPEAETGIEGIAVDPATVEHPEGRIYVLAIQPRGAELEVDPEVTAAGALYAFKTEPSGEKLVRAAGTKEGKESSKGVLESEGGVLAGPKALQTQSTTQGQALLEPSGLAVDPTTHDVILLGLEDRGEKAVEPAMRTALERISSKGALGARWVDNSDFFEEEVPTSPAVSKTGKVYVVGGELGLLSGTPGSQIDRIPSNFESAGAPTPLIQFDTNLEEVIEFPGVPVVGQGGGLAIAPEGRLYTRASANEEGKRKVAAIAFGYSELGEAASATELGWTGGANWTRNAGHVPCGISFEGHPMVAAGGEERLFIFDSNPEAPDVVELGPGGSGCPEASVGSLEASVKGAPVVAPVAVGTQVSFSAKLARANALSVEWNFGDGTSETVAADSQTTTITHTFTHEGEFSITEKIHTDNLTTPTLSPLSVKLTAKASPPTALFSWPPEATVGQPAEFNGVNSKDPNGSSITKWTWSFGDGTETTTTTPKVTHTYTAAGSPSVTLKVTDALGLTSAPVAHSLTVSAATVTTPTTTTTTPTTTTTTPTTTTTTPPPGGGVASYQASFAGTSVSVSSSGTFVIKINCLGQSSCTGTVTLRTLTAVRAGAGKRKILTLTLGSFAVAGGHVATVKLKLSAAARKLLASSRVLRTRATIAAHDSAGALHTTQATFTLRSAKHH